MLNRWILICFVSVACCCVLSRVQHDHHESECERKSGGILFAFPLRKRKRNKISRFVRVGFWQNRFFSPILSPDFFSSTFVGEKCPEESSRKIPGEILEKILQQKSPTHFCRGAGPRFSFVITSVSGFRKRGRRNGVASDFFRFFRFFRFLPCFLSVFLRFFSDFFLFFRFIFRKKKHSSRDPFCETPTVRCLSGSAVEPLVRCLIWGTYGVRGLAARQLTCHTDTQRAPLY